MIRKYQLLKNYQNIEAGEIGIENVNRKSKKDGSNVVEFMDSNLDTKGFSIDVCENSPTFFRNLADGKRKSLVGMALEPLILKIYGKMVAGEGEIRIISKGGRGRFYVHTEETDIDNYAAVVGQVLQKSTMESGEIEMFSKYIAATLIGTERVKENLDEALTKIVAGDEDFY